MKRPVRIRKMILGLIADLFCRFLYFFRVYDKCEMWAQNAYRYALLLLRAKGVKLAEMFYWSSSVRFAFLHGLLEAFRFITPTSPNTKVIISKQSFQIIQRR